jgi:S-adenosylmethionine synthetase
MVFRSRRRVIPFGRRRVAVFHDLRFTPKAFSYSAIDSAASGLLLVMGEIATDCYVDVQGVARETVRRIGYTDLRFGFDADSCALLVSLTRRVRTP